MGGIYWLSSYPKSGNTWFRAVLANYLSNSDEPININKLKTGSIASSRNWIDDILGVDTADLSQEETEALRPDIYRWTASETDEVGYHKIHDAYSHRSDGRPLVDDHATLGALYFLRNPLDVAPSLANHNNTDIDTAITQMADPNFGLARGNKRLSNQLLQRMGTWSQHVKSWVDAEEIPVHILRYEDMQIDPLKFFSNAFDALGFDTKSDKLLQALEFSRFEKLKAQEMDHGFVERPPNIQHFFRKGKMGDWRNVLNDQQVHSIIKDHQAMMKRFGYIDTSGLPT